MSYAASLSSVAVGLRVADVRGAAGFYERIGFTRVMAVPDENDDWILCLLRFGNGSILLGAVDHPRFPRAGNQRRGLAEVREPRARVQLDVPDLVAIYTACVRARCQITAEPAQDVWGDRSFSCLDPFGYEWRFTQAVGATPCSTNSEQTRSDRRADAHMLLA